MEVTKYRLLGDPFNKLKHVGFKWLLMQSFPSEKDTNVSPVRLSLVILIFDLTI